MAPNASARGRPQEQATNITEKRIPRGSKASTQSIPGEEQEQQSDSHNNQEHGQNQKQVEIVAPRPTDFQTTGTQADTSAINHLTGNQANPSAIMQQGYSDPGMGGFAGNMYGSSYGYGGGGYYGSPYGYGAGGMLPMGIPGAGALSNLNQFLFSVQSVIFSLGQAVQIIGMNTQALKQLLESVSSMIDHATSSWRESMQQLEAQQQEESEECRQRRRRLRALRLAMVAGLSYLGYRIARYLLSPSRQNVQALPYFSHQGNGGPGSYPPTRDANSG